MGRAGTGKVAGAKTLFDLLFEATDQEHLAQKIAQRLLAHRCIPLDFGQSAGSVRSGS